MRCVFDLNIPARTSLSDLVKDVHCHSSPKQSWSRIDRHRNRAVFKSVQFSIWRDQSRQTKIVTSDSQTKLISNIDIAASACTTAQTHPFMLQCQTIASSFAV